MASVVYAPRDDQLEPFSRDLLLTSLYESCKHRPDAALVAGPLTDTIVQRLLTTTAAPSVIERKHLTDEVLGTLRRFDEYAARHYEAYFTKRA
jgi:transcriptional regulator NrdR family protein